MPNSVLEAIKQGIWDFEPRKLDSSRYCSTEAMPGTKQKLDMLAERVSKGLPLWHPSDRSEYDDPIRDFAADAPARSCESLVEELLAEED